MAQWKYRQAFVAQLKNADGTWSNVTTGGTVSSKLKGAKGSIDAGDGSGKDEDAYKKSGVAYFVDDGTFVEAVAAPKEGYHLRVGTTYRIRTPRSCCRLHPPIRTT